MLTVRLSTHWPCVSVYTLTVRLSVYTLTVCLSVGLHTDRASSVYTLIVHLCLHIDRVPPRVEQCPKCNGVQVLVPPGYSVHHFKSLLFSERSSMATNTEVLPVPCGDQIPDFPAVIRKWHLKAVTVQSFLTRTVTDSFAEITWFLREMVV